MVAGRTILVALLLGTTSLAFGQISSFKTLVEKETFYQNAKIEGSIGQSLILTTAENRLRIIDTANANTVLQESLPDNTSVYVHGNPMSTFGIIEIEYRNESGKRYRSFVYQHGQPSLIEGNAVKKGDFAAVYPDSESPDDARQRDYLTVVNVTSKGNALLTSNATSNQLLIYGLVGNAETTTNRTLFFTFTQADRIGYRCTNADSTQALRVNRSPSGQIEALTIDNIPQNKGKRVLLDGQTISVSTFQCFTAANGDLQVLIDATLPEPREFENLPVRTIRTSDTTYDTVTTNRHKTNHIRLFFDGETEHLTPGYVRYDKETSKVYPTPLAQDVFVDIGVHNGGDSVLSTMDYKTAILLPENPRVVIQYPYKPADKRLYCIFGQQYRASQADVYKSCYVATLNR